MTVVAKSILPGERRAVYILTAEEDSIEVFDCWEDANEAYQEVLGRGYNEGSLTEVTTNTWVGEAASDPRLGGLP